MKVLYDHQIFTLQDYGGISRIYTELMKPDKENNYQPDLSLVFSNNHYLKEVDTIKYHTFFPNSQFPRKIQLMNLINKNKTIKLLRKGNFDIFHPTYYDPYFLPYLKKKPFVVTFLDMIHEKFGKVYEEFTQDKLIFEGKKQILNAAKTIISISENTKKDLIEIYNVEPQKIKVVYLATNLAKANNKALHNFPYLLFVGRRERYKNFNTLLKAMPYCIKQFPEVKLICAGGGKFNDEEIKQIANYNLQDNIQQVPFHSDEVLSNLYTYAKAFIFPSLYEGFGIPILEAFACNCPVIASNVSSLPEVGGNACLYFDGNDEKDIANKISELLSNSILEKHLKEKGYERNKIFTWEENRRQTTEIYQQILQ